jgi:hypothetical protein
MTTSLHKQGKNDAAAYAVGSATLAVTTAAAALAAATHPSDKIILQRRLTNARNQLAQANINATIAAQ